jgi:hypothetical protein
VTRELNKAPEPKKSKMLSLIDTFYIEVLEANDEAENLADIYISEGIFPLRYRLDSLHIAIATIFNLEYVLSFNYSHINKRETKEMTSKINIQKGYNIVNICTPKELLNEEK